ncbi:hypothetical protein GQX74_007468 [Glossina fuscipes]|nr:hypothetical protein GQX74_007468 [Glossina fuscipes]
MFHARVLERYAYYMKRSPDYEYSYSVRNGKTLPVANMLIKYFPFYYFHQQIPFCYNKHTNEQLLIKATLRALCALHALRASLVPLIGLQNKTATEEMYKADANGQTDRPISLWSDKLAGSSLPTIFQQYFNPKMEDKRVKKIMYRTEWNDALHAYDVLHNKHLVM